MAWTIPRTWVSGETVTAAQLNTHVRDNLKALGDAWASYTVNPTQGGTAVVLGTGGTCVGRYLQAGKLVAFQIVMTLGSASVASGPGELRFSLPVTPQDNYAANGAGLTVAPNDQFFWRTGVSGTAVVLYRPGATTTATGGSAGSFGLTTNSILTFGGTYESA